MTVKKEAAMRNALDKFFSVEDPHETHETQEAHDAHTEQNAHKAHNESSAHNTHTTHKTSKANRTASERVNVFLTPEIFDYLQTMAAVCSTSMTGYITRLISDDMERSGDLYAQAKELSKKIQNR